MNPSELSSVSLHSLDVKKAWLKIPDKCSCIAMPNPVQRAILVLELFFFRVLSTCNKLKTSISSADINDQRIVQAD